MKASVNEEKSVKELDVRIVAQFSKAEDAFNKGHYDYVNNLCSEWIKNYPEVFDFRVLLRQAQFHKKFPNGHVLPSSDNWLSQIKSFRNKPGKNPLKVITSCERTLAINPLDLRANELLASTAIDVGWPETAIFSLKTALKNPKRKPEHVIHLTTLLLENHRIQEALEICETFSKFFPESQEIHEIRNKISIQQSLSKVSDS